MKTKLIYYGRQNGLQNWLPGPTRYRFKIAWHHCILHGRGSIVSTVSSRRMYVSPKQLDHFLDFITSTHIVQDLPFGKKTLKLSTKIEIAVPNVIRTLIPEPIVQQNNAFCRESGFELQSGQPHRPCHSKQRFSSTGRCHATVMATLPKAR